MTQLPFQKQERVLKGWMKRVWAKALMQIKKTPIPVYTERQFQAQATRLHKYRIKEIKKVQKASFLQFCQLKREWEKVAMPQQEPVVFTEISSCDFKNPTHYDYRPPQWGRDLAIMVRMSSQMLDLAPMGDQREYLCEMIEYEVNRQVRQSLMHANMVRA